MSRADDGWATRIAVGAAAALAAGSCGDEQPAPRLEPTLEVATWLQAGNDAAAVAAVATLFESAHPETEVLVHRFEGDDVPLQVLRRIQESMAAGSPDDVIHSVAGEELFRYARQGLLLPLDDVATRDGWSSAIPASVLGQVTLDGRIYGVPLNVERENLLFYRIAVFAELGLPTPDELDSFDALLELCDDLRDADVAPMRLATDEGWLVAMVFLEHVVPAVAGAEFYRDYFAGRTDGGEATMREALVAFEGLAIRCLGDAPPTEGWTAGPAAVASGEAAMTLGGDFISGALVGAGAAPLEDFWMTATPGTRDVFAFASIAFAVPTAAGSPRAATELAALFASPEGQLAFNELKGSIPVAAGAARDLEDPVQAANASDLQRPDIELIATPSALAPAEYKSGTPQLLGANDVLVRFLRGDTAAGVRPFDVDAAGVALRALHDNYLSRR